MKTNPDGTIKLSSIRNEFHFQTQLNTRMQIRRNRKKYTRKVKHKGQTED